MWVKDSLSSGYKDQTKSFQHAKKPKTKQKTKIITSPKNPSWGNWISLSWDESHWMYLTIELKVYSGTSKCVL